jgi:hypothetical protein
MQEITPHGFDQHIRKSLLLSGHEFTHEKLNRVRNIFDHALVATKHTTLRKAHFDDALRHMEEHHDWKHLSEKQKGAVVSAFKNQLNIEDGPTED